MTIGTASFTDMNESEDGAETSSAMRSSFMGESISLSSFRHFLLALNARGERHVNRAQKLGRCGELIWLKKLKREEKEEKEKKERK